MKSIECALNFCRKYAGAIQAFSTVILVLITWWYASETSKISSKTDKIMNANVEMARANEQMAKISEKNLKLSQDLLENAQQTAKYQSLPLLSFETMISPYREGWGIDHTVYLVNLGNGPAKKINLQMDGKLSSYLIKAVPLLGPGQKYKILFVAHGIKSGDIDTGSSGIKINYEDLRGEKYEQKISLAFSGEEDKDLRKTLEFQDFMFEFKGLGIRIDSISKSLEEQNRILREQGKRKSE